jgi:hypothetical protein
MPVMLAKVRTLAIANGVRKLSAAMAKNTNTIKKLIRATISGKL